MSHESANSRRTSSLLLRWAVGLDTVFLLALAAYIWAWNPQNISCPGSGITTCGLLLALALLIAGFVGGVCAIVATAFAIGVAARGRDWVTVVLLSFVPVVAVACSYYLYLLWAGENPNSFSAQSPQPYALAGPALIVALFGLPVAILVYATLRNRRLPLRLALSGLLALTLVLTVLAFGQTRDNGPLQLNVSLAPKPQIDCAHGVYPPITLVNTGSAALRWTAQPNIAPDNITVTPANGALGPGQRQSITPHGAFSQTDTGFVGFGIDISAQSAGYVPQGFDQTVNITC
ncbi:MAG TPA: hypothetical protein VF808_06405 [Ktedonobacterales bacterium]